MKPVRIRTSHAMMSRFSQTSWPRAVVGRPRRGTRVVGVILHDLESVDEVVADHAAQFGIGVRPVRAGRVEQRDVVRGMRLLVRNSGQHQMIRGGTRDVGKHDPDLVIQRDPIPQSRRADGLLKRGYERPAWIRQGRDKLWLDDRGVPGIREVNPQSGFSIRKFDAGPPPKMYSSKSVTGRYPIRW